MDKLDTEKLCRLAGRADLASWLKGYHDGMRRTLFKRLDWACEQWLSSASRKESNGWLDENEGSDADDGDLNDSSHNRYPSRPTLNQLHNGDEYLQRLSTMRAVWAPIDVIEDGLWKDRSDSNVWLLLVGSRMYTYAKYRMVTLYEGKQMSITEQTKMYGPPFPRRCDC